MQAYVSKYFYGLKKSRKIRKNSKKLSKNSHSGWVNSNLPEWNYCLDKQKKYVLESKITNFLHA